MTKFLFSFPADAMQHLTPEELQRASVDSHAVVALAKAAGVWVFGGAINEAISPVRVHADGSVSDDTYDRTHLSGGYAILELPDRASAEKWARKFAEACRCPQEVREFHYDPES